MINFLVNPHISSVLFDNLFGSFSFAIGLFDAVAYGITLRSDNLSESDLELSES